MTVYWGFTWTFALPSAFAGYSHMRMFIVRHPTSPRRFDIERRHVATPWSRAKTSPQDLLSRRCAWLARTAAEAGHLTSLRRVAAEDIEPRNTAATRISKNHLPALAAGCRSRHGFLARRKSAAPCRSTAGGSAYRAKAPAVRSRCTAGTRQRSGDAARCLAPCAAQLPGLRPGRRAAQPVRRTRLSRCRSVLSLPPLSPRNEARACVTHPAPATLVLLVFESPWRGARRCGAVVKAVVVAQGLDEAVFRRAILSFISELRAAFREVGMTTASACQDRFEPWANGSTVGVNATRQHARTPDSGLRGRRIADQGNPDRRISRRGRVRPASAQQSAPGPRWSAAQTCASGWRGATRSS